MSHSRAETMRVEERRAKVAALALQGLRPSEIARRLFRDDSQRSRVKVSQDLKAVREQWKASGVRDYEADRGRLLAEIALAKREAWRSWRRSLRDGAPGNLKCLNLLLDLFAKEAEILGLTDGSTKIVMQQVAGPVMQLTPDQKLEALRSVLAAARRQSGEQSEAQVLLNELGDPTPLYPGAPSPPTDDGSQDGSGEPLPVGLKELPDGPLFED
jgi:hypothetical protein